SPSGKSNAAFFDGSVRTLSFDEMYRDTDHNLFHPEASPPTGVQP
ncbi:MAG TPA: hypothetical protein EYO33_30630, partial [Phycisphaerales bacterium]|nr:hypothetical protein [Phycisphaerales bacterium]